MKLTLSEGWNWAMKFIEIELSGSWNSQHSYLTIGTCYSVIVENLLLTWIWSDVKFCTFLYQSTTVYAGFFTPNIIWNGPESIIHFLFFLKILKSSHFGPRMFYICVILATASIFLVKTLMCQCEMNPDNGLTCCKKMVSTISATGSLGSLPVFDKMTTFRTWELGQKSECTNWNVLDQTRNFKFQKRWKLYDILGYQLGNFIVGVLPNIFI